MDLFGRFRKLDSSLQRGLDNGFARVFGGEVVPAEIDELLKQEAEDALMEDRAGTVHAPSVFEVHVAVHDYETLLSSRPTLDQELRDRLNRFIRNEGWTVSAPVSVDLIKDDSMHTGQLRCRSSFPAAQQRGGTTGPSADPASPRNNPAVPAQHNTQHSSEHGISSQDAGSTESSVPEWPQSEPHSGRNPVARPYNADSSDGDPANPTENRTSSATASSANPASSTSANPAASSAAANASAATSDAAAHAAGAGALAGLARPQRRPTGWGQPSQSPEGAAPGGHSAQAPHPAQDPASTSDPHSAPHQAAATPEPGPTPPPETEVVTGPSAATINGVDGLHTTGSGGYQAAQQRTVTLHLRDGSDRTYVLKPGSNTIGRGNQVDFRLPDTGVSRRHGDITWDGFDAVLTDLRSTNGTTVNEIPVENWLLADGDVISMGHSEIEVHFR